jgi:hypothetical protein
MSFSQIREDNGAGNFTFPRGTVPWVLRNSVWLALISQIQEQARWQISGKIYDRYYMGTL